MFISIDQISQALEDLDTIHPFYGITLLVCKLAPLPVGRTVDFAINAKEKEFLDRYYKPYQSSKFYYRAFRLSDKSKKWVGPKYASSGLQSTRTREFRDAFIHTTNTDIWGWNPDYPLC